MLTCLLLVLATAVLTQVESASAETLPAKPWISPTNWTVFRHGERLTCVSDNNPQLEYHWMTTSLIAETKPGQVFMVDICEITSDKLVQQHLKDAAGDQQSINLSVECVARSGAQSSSSAKRDITVMFATEDIRKHCASSRVVYLAVGLVISSIIAIITIAVAVIYARRRLECRCATNGKSAVDENSLSSGVTHYAEIHEQEINSVSVPPTPVLPAAFGVVPDIDVPPHYENVPSRHRLNEASLENLVMTKPYDVLNPETREPPRPPTVYSRISRQRP